MIDWIGHLIANWPLWAAVLALIVVSIVWVLMNVSINGAAPFWGKKSWWQDQEVERQRKLQNRTQKAKKG